MARKPSVCESEVGEPWRGKVMGEAGSMGTLESVPAQGHAMLIVSGYKGGYSPHPPLHRASVGPAHAQGAYPPSALSQVRSYMRQVLEGICYLHQHSVLHLDIKVSVGLSHCLPPHARTDGLLPRCGGLGPADGGHPFPGGEPLPPAKLPSAPCCPVARKPPDGGFEQRAGPDL